MFVYHPVLNSPLGDMKIWCRPLLRIEDGQKTMRVPPNNTAYVDAPTAIQMRKKSPPWYEPENDHPLVMKKPGGILLCDLDRISEALAQEVKERLSTYWDVSYSGNGFHAYAFTEQTHLLGRKHLVFYPSDDHKEKLEFFVGIQPVILTNKHAVLRPMNNCDLELVKLVDDLQKKIPGNAKGGKVVVDNSQSFPSALFIPWLTTHAQIVQNYPQQTKRLILKHIWEKPLYAYERDGWLPFYVEEEAKHFKMLPRDLTKHLGELEDRQWLFRRHSRYASGMRSLALRLNIPKQFFTDWRE